jgi:amino acid adenylation domain-containing protein
MDIAPAVEPPLSTPEARPRATQDRPLEGATARTLDPSLAALLQQERALHPERTVALAESAFAFLLARHLEKPDVSFLAAVDGQPASACRAHVSDDTSVADLAAALLQQSRSPGTFAVTRETEAPPRDSFRRVFHAPHFLLGDASTVGDAELPRFLPSPGASSRLTLELKTGSLLFEHPGLSREAAARTLDVYQHLLRVFFLAPSQQLLGQIPTLPPDERQRVLMLGNDTEREPPPAETIHAGFERQAALHPHAVALEADGQAFTFGQIDRWANQLAHALRERGAKPGMLIGVCTERGVNLVVALLGVLKSGAAYVPLDPHYPRDRLGRMVTTAEMSLAVTEVHLQHLLGVRSILLDRGTHRSFAELPTSAPLVEISPRDPCYAIFTSGSTGEPKGVLMTHVAVANTLAWVNERCGVGPWDRALFVTSPSFDLSVYDIFGVLGAGGTLVVASAALRDDPSKLAEALAARRITFWNSTPAAFEQLLPFLPEASTTAPFPPLRWVLLSGDWIPLTLPPALRTRFPRAGLLALGGATEAAIWSNSFYVEDLDPTWNSIPYGRPIANMRYHVLDERRQPTPVGVSGELYIGGVGLAEGYVNRPALTAERFIPDPFRPGERLYRTGDRARYMESGDIELLGRLDRQVKIRGFRVEMAEVEAALVGCRSVRHGACVTHTDASGQHVLCAYVVPWPGTATDGDAVRHELARTLPPYMVPDHVVLCEKLPLSPQGKIDRQALPRPVGGTTSARHVAPRTPHEESMHAIWCELLGRDRVSVTETFAALGGHSLLAVKLVTEVRARLGADLSISALLAYPTIESLVGHLFGEGEDTDPPARRAKPVFGARAPHLLALQEKGHRPPLILIAGVGGFAFTYRNFPSFLGPDQPVYAFQSVGAELWEDLAEHSIEELAAIYERELEVLGPALDANAPLVLGGFSFGILPAFELACRLARRGRRVPLLVSLDGFSPGYPRPRNMASRALEHVFRLARAEGDARRDYVDARLFKLKERAYRVLGKEAALAPDLPFEAAANERLKQLWVFHRRAARRYLPKQPADARLLLVRVETPEQWPGTDMSDPLYGWERHVTGPVSMATIPATHTELLVSAAHQKAAADIISRHIDAVVAAERLAEHGRFVTPAPVEEVPAAQA